MSNQKFKCVASFDYHGVDNDLLQKGSITVMVDSVQNVSDGFWINKDLEYSKKFDECMFYIMPHHIKNIEKVMVIEDEPVNAIN